MEKTKNSTDLIAVPSAIGSFTLGPGTFLQSRGVSFINNIFNKDPQEFKNINEYTMH